MLPALPGVLVLSCADLGPGPVARTAARSKCGLQPTSGLLRKLSLLASQLVRLIENSTGFAKTHTQGLDSTMLHQQLIIKSTRS